MDLMNEYQEKKVINAEPAVPYVDVVGTVTYLMAQKLHLSGFQVRCSSKGILEIEYVGKKVIIKVEEG